MLLELLNDQIAIFSHDLTIAGPVVVCARKHVNLLLVPLIAVSADAHDLEHVPGSGITIGLAFVRIDQRVRSTRIRLEVPDLSLHEKRGEIDLMSFRTSSWRICKG
jgi:hypothetical protein